MGLTSFLKLAAFIVEPLLVQLSPPDLSPKTSLQGFPLNVLQKVNFLQLPKSLYALQRSTRCNCQALARLLS